MLGGLGLLAELGGVKVAGGSIMAVPEKNATTDSKMENGETMRE